MTRAALLAVLMLASASITAGAGPKTIHIGAVKLKGQSRLCIGVGGDEISRSLNSRLSKSKLFLVTGPRSRTTADYILTGEILCHQKHLEFVVQLIQVETSEIAWSKVQTLDGFDQMPAAINKIARLLAAFFQAGQTPDEAESSLGRESPLFGHTVTVFPLHAATKGFPEKQLLASTRYFRAGLADAVKCDPAAIGEVQSAIQSRKYRACVDEKCHLEVAGDLGTTKAIAAEVVRRGKRCALAYTLYDIERRSIEQAASIFIKCTRPGLKVGVDKLIRQLSGK